MKKELLTLGMIIILILPVMGCIDSTPKPPASEIPKVIIDHNLEGEKYNDSIIYVHGFEETRYKNISISINNETVLHKNDTFAAEFRTNLTIFNLTVNVHSLDKWYNFNATFEILIREENILKITYYDGDIDRIKFNNLPFKETLNMMEEKEDA